MHSLAIPGSVSSWSVPRRPARWPSVPRGRRGRRAAPGARRVAGGEGWGAAARRVRGGGGAGRGGRAAAGRGGGAAGAMRAPRGVGREYTDRGGKEGGKGGDAARARRQRC